MQATITINTTTDQGPVTIPLDREGAFVANSIPQCSHRSWTPAGTCADCGSRWDAPLDIEGF